MTRGLFRAAERRTALKRLRERLCVLPEEAPDSRAGGNKNSLRGCLHQPRPLRRARKLKLPPNDYCYDSHGFYISLVDRNTFALFRGRNGSRCWRFRGTSIDSS